LQCNWSGEEIEEKIKVDRNKKKTQRYRDG